MKPYKQFNRLLLIKAFKNKNNLSATTRTTEGLMRCTKTSESSSHSSPKKSGIITIEYVLQQRLFKRQKKKRMSQCRSQFNTPQERGHSKSSPGSFSLLRFKIFLKTKTWKETIIFSYVVTLLRSGSEEKRLTTPTRATLPSLALHANPFIHLLFPTRNGHKNAGFRATSFALILFFSQDYIHPSSASLFYSPACNHPHQPQALPGHGIR